MSLWIAEPIRSGTSWIQDDYVQKHCTKCLKLKLTLHTPKSTNSCNTSNVRCVYVYHHPQVHPLKLPWCEYAKAVEQQHSECSVTSGLCEGVTLQIYPIELEWVKRRGGGAFQSCQKALSPWTSNQCSSEVRCSSPIERGREYRGERGKWR